MECGGSDAALAQPGECRGSHNMQAVSSALTPREPSSVNTNWSYIGFERVPGFIQSGVALRLPHALRYIRLPMLKPKRGVRRQRRRFG